MGSTRGRPRKEAKKNENRGNSSAEPSKNAPETIDVEPTHRAPAGLTTRITAFHPYLYRVDLVGDRNVPLPGYTLRFSTSPPDMAAELIADQVAAWALEHAEKRGHGPGTAVRVWMRGRLDPDDPKTERSRWATLRVLSDGDGELHVVDDPEAEVLDDKISAYREMVSAQETAARIISDQMERVAKTTAHFVAMSDSVAKMLESLGTYMARNTAHELKIAELVTHANVEERRIAYQFARLQRIGDFFGPSAERVGSFTEQVLNDLWHRYQQAGAPTSSGTASRAARLNAFMNRLSDDELQGASRIFTDDESSLIQAMRVAPTEADFAAQRTKLEELTRPRLAEIQDALVRLLGVDRALELRNLLR